MNRREGEDRMDMIDRKDKRVGEKIWRGRLARTGYIEQDGEGQDRQDRRGQTGWTG